MARWVAYLETPSDPFDAPDRIVALQIATRIYGSRLVRVQSEASAAISEQERAAARKRRRPWEEPPG